MVDQKVSETTPGFVFLPGHHPRPVLPPDTLTTAGLRTNLIAMEKIATMKYGALLALLALCYGFGLGGVFGAFEEDIKAHLKTEGEAVVSQAYGGDAAKMQKVADKSWVYFKRAHLHANGLGTAALALILLLACLPAAASTRRLAALALGTGAVLYPLFWMWAGLRAPGMGGTGAAKASLQWLAVPSAGLCILGLLWVLVLALKGFLSSPRVGND